MKRMAVSEFKAHALQVIGQVAATKEGVILTKRGKPLAEVVPCRNAPTKWRMGGLAHTVVYIGDVISPLGEEDWEAAR